MFLASPSGCKPSSPPRSPQVDEAHGYLKKPEEATSERLRDLAKTLKSDKQFGLARMLLDLAWSMNPPDGLRHGIRQDRALCTYKDPDLPLTDRLERAFEILCEEEDLRTTADQETLGLAGAIFKRRWAATAQKQHLERALSYYRRAHDLGPEKDLGYTGINAAFVLDLLGHLEASEAAEAGDRSRVAEERRAEARAIREELVRVLPPLLEQEASSELQESWWFHATMIEALFGLERYEKAESWVDRGMALSDVPEWEYRSTATQLVELARLQSAGGITTQEFGQSPAGTVLLKLLGNRAAGLRSAVVGKVGLALSGGGFRASLFHIGVLARLAELDLLRHVEVLSCVSGGSILGAHYYLEVKKLLEEKADHEISRQDYVDLVKQVEVDFLAGVQKNIRTRVAAEFTTNVKMLWPSYSRTMRAGELYERHLYSRVQDGAGKRPRWITDLFIRPVEDAEDFSPRRDNWRRRAKVPELILNATTLNTGHNWQFTASWMGEPPERIDTDVDANGQLRRMYYWEAPKKHQCIRLGHAVGASACVPGLFEPLPLDGLYEGRTVQLVDGGVHDNQGVAGVLQSDCSVVLVSDASGQMGSVDRPSPGLLGVPLRSNSILMSRIRVEQYNELVARHRSGLLRGLMFIHLTQDMHEDPVDWVGCESPFEVAAPARPASEQELHTSYGVLKSVQKQISAIRTDLDSFSNAEAWALMASGYRMTKRAFTSDPALQGIATDQGSAEDWRFLAVDHALRDVDAARPLSRLLDVSSKRAFKVWHLVTPLKAVAVILGLLAIAGLGWLAWNHWDRPLVRVSTVGGAALVALGGAVFGKSVMRIMQFRSTVVRAATGVALALVGWLVARTHIWVFDRLFLKLGRWS